jgi:RND family efflux transporter MFP subunit
MKVTMKHSLLRLISLNVLLIVLISPGSPAFASQWHQPASAEKSVTASAVVVPAQTFELGFLISGIAKNVQVKEGDVVKAGQILIVLDTPDLQFAVTEAQAALRAAQSEATIQSYRRVKNQRKGQTFYDVVPTIYRQRLDIKVQQAQVALELAQLNLAEATLTSPSDGIVASVSVRPGEFVSSDQAVITLATLNNLQLETTDLSERDIPNVKIGSPVSISLASLNQTFTGKVISISPIANTVGGDVVFKVTIAFDEQPKGLLWGMTAEVTIE